MRIYEELFIVRPDITDEEADHIVDQVKSVITNAAGTVDKVEKWGVRKLAYRVGKRNEGFYILIQFSATSSTVKEVERRLRVNDSVMKFITVRIDEKLKKLDKRKKQREKRAARKPAPVVAPSAPLDPLAMMPASPGAPMPGAPVAEEEASPVETPEKES